MLLNCDVEEDFWEPLGQQGNQSWIFIGRTDAEADAPVLWPPDMKSQLIRKDLDAGNYWRQEEKDNTFKFLALFKEIRVRLPGKSHARRSLLGYSPCSREELDTPEQLHFHFQGD